MNIEQLNAMAHQITYDCMRKAIINVFPWKESPVQFGEGRWYDITEVVRDPEHVANLEKAVIYLGARGLLLRHKTYPWLVMVMPPRSDGEVMPHTLQPIKARA
jgi:hypothetical protein